MAVTHGTSAAAWAARAHDLALWTMTHLVNRHDVWIEYLPERERSYSKLVRVAPAKALRGQTELTVAILARHYAATHGGELIGLHTTACDQTARWLAVDLCNRDSTAPTTAAISKNAALGWYDTLCDRGFQPILEDSNGRGDYHLLVLFEVPVEVEKVYKFGRSLISNYGEFGLTAAPKLFPGRSRIEPGELGDWFRLTGRHHSHTHWSKVWDGSDWLEDDDAVNLILRTRIELIDPVTDATGPVSKIPANTPQDGDTTWYAGDQEIERAIRYLKRLNPARVDNHDMWLQVGMILHNLDHSPAMLEEWEHWCRQNPNYAPGKCVQVWGSFDQNRSKPHALATLVIWAKADTRAAEMLDAQRESGATKEQPDTSTGRSRVQDPDLDLIVSKWPDLPDEVKAGMVAMACSTDHEQREVSV